MSAAQSIASPLDRLEEYADLEIRRRSLPAGPVYLALFSFILWVTPVEARFPGIVKVFGAATGGVSAALIALSLGWKRFFPSRKSLWRKLFLAANDAAAFNFGCFCAFVIAAAELSWTSFVVVLITFGICTGMTSSLAPKFPVLIRFLWLMLSPAVFVNLLYIGGLRGNALAGLFMAIFALLLGLGYLQHRSYWDFSQSRARLQAVIDAVPGTMAWVSSDGRYIGVNTQLAELWNKHPSEFLGKKIGFADPRTSVRPFAESLFVSQESRQIREIERVIGGERRHYMMVAQKYNMDTEAVIVGIDITDFKRGQQEVAQHRAQSRMAARLATLGEMMEKVPEEMSRPLEKLQEELRVLRSGKGTRRDLDVMEAELQRLIRFENGMKHLVMAGDPSFCPLITVGEMIEDLAALCSAPCEKEGIRFSAGAVDPAVAGKKVAAEVFQVLLSLAQSAQEAVKSGPEKWIRVDVFSLLPSEKGRMIKIMVTDSGAGIPDEVRDRIFDPFFAHSGELRSAGMGLSLAREMIESYRGRLYLDPSSANTRFVIQLAV